MKFDIAKLNPAEIQAMLDEQFKARGISAYAEYVKYVPQGGTPPAGATHFLTLSSAKTSEVIQVAVKAKGVWAMLVDFVLGVL
jgi:hypothetical protein